MSQITGQLAQDMVRDWLKTPVNGYLGSSYGQDFKRILHRPMSAPRVDEQIAKLREDVPVLGMLPPDAVNLYSYQDPALHDRLKVALEVAGRTFPLESDED